MQAAEQGEKLMQTLAELQHLWEFWEVKSSRTRGRAEYQRWKGVAEIWFCAVEANQMKNRTRKTFLVTF